MAELTTLVEEQSKKIDQLIKGLSDLTILVMKDKVDTTWVTEEVAAEMIGIQPAWLRRKVRKNEKPWNEIGYRHTNGRNFQYSRKGIINFKRLTSNT